MKNEYKMAVITEHHWFVTIYAESEEDALNTTWDRFEQIIAAPNHDYDQRVEIVRPK